MLETKIGIRPVVLVVVILIGIKPVVDVVVVIGIGMSPVVVDVVGEVDCGAGVVEGGAEPGVVEGGAVVGGTPHTQIQLAVGAPVPLVVTEDDGVVVEDKGIGD